MNDLFLMDVIESFANFSDDRAAICLFHSMGFPEGLKQLSASCELHKEVNIFLIGKIAVEGRNIPVGKVELNAEFSCYLILVFLFLNLFLMHDFHGTEKTCVFVNHHHDLAELTFSHFLTHDKVTLFELWCFFFLSQLSDRRGFIGI